MSNILKEILLNTTKQAHLYLCICMEAHVIKEHWLYIVTVTVQTLNRWKSPNHEQESLEATVRQATHCHLSGLAPHFRLREKGNASLGGYP